MRSFLPTLYEYSSEQHACDWNDVSVIQRRVVNALLLTSIDRWPKQELWNTGNSRRIATFASKYYDSSFIYEYPKKNDGEAMTSGTWICSMACSLLSVYPDSPKPRFHSEPYAKGAHENSSNGVNTDGGVYQYKDSNENSQDF